MFDVNVISSKHQQFVMITMLCSLDLFKAISGAVN